MPRFTVRVDRIPHDYRRLGFVAWIADARHPDGTEDDASCAWFVDKRDAERIAAALNRDAELRLAVHAVDAGAT